MGQRQVLVRRKRPNETRIQNGIIWDKNLCNMARFALIAMLSLPETWDYSVRGMAVMLNLSKDTMSKYMKELEQAGYLKREQTHSENGKFSSADYILTDTPWDFGEEDESEPCTEISDTGDTQPCPNLSAPTFSAPKKSPQKKRTKEWKRTEEYSPYSPPAGDTPPAESEPVDKLKPRVRKPRREKSMPDHDPEAFETFWDAYPRKDNRKKAIEAWDKLKPDRELCRTMYAALKRHRQLPQWAEEGGRYIPMFSTWLNGRRWENQGVDLSLIHAEPPRGPGGWADDPEVPS